MSPQPKPPLNPEDDRKGRRDHQHVIQVAREEGRLQPRLQKPAVQRIDGHPNQEQFVPEIPKPVHNRAHMATPEQIASNSFKTLTMGEILRHLGHDSKRLNQP